MSLNGRHYKILSFNILGDKFLREILEKHHDRFLKIVKNQKMFKIS